MSPRRQRHYNKPMSPVDLDDHGVIVACTGCGQKNRLLYERLDGEVRVAVDAALVRTVEDFPVDGDVFLHDPFAHEFCGYGRKQDAVAVMACGDRKSVHPCGAKQGEMIGRIGTQTTPKLHDFGVRQNEKLPSSWPQLCVKWLRSQGLLNLSSRE